MSDLSMVEKIEIRLSPEFSQRAVDLARRHDVEAACKHIRTRHMLTQFEVSSATAKKTYTVIADRSGAVWCECLGASWDKPCWHAGAAILVMRHMAHASMAYAYQPESYPGQHSPLMNHTAKAVSIFKSE